MSDNVTAFPRAIRQTPSPLGFYLRPGRSDHKELTTVLLSGPQKLFGAVIDATLTTLQKDLREQLLSNRLDVILDPKTQPAAFEYGFRPGMAKLPWGSAQAQHPDEFRAFSGRQRIVKLAEFAIENNYTQILSPTHYIASVNDPWFGIDLETTRWLRYELDKRGGKRIPIIYSLAIANALFRSADERAALITALAELPIESLWLKVDGFGADAGPLTLLRTMDAMAQFHSLGIPIIADHVGGVPGLSLLAFGSVGGIAHGITMGEGFDSSSWRRPKPSSGGGGGWRIYSPSLGMTLSKKEAETLFSASPRARGLFANRNTSACPRGVDDMIGQPVRAFVIQRAEEVASLGATPADLRPQQFLEKSIRPMTDCALAATKIAWDESDPVAQKLNVRMAKHRKRVEDWRIALGGRVNKGPAGSIALQPETRIAREASR